MVVLHGLFRRAHFYKLGLRGVTGGNIHASRLLCLLSHPTSQHSNRSRIEKREVEKAETAILGFSGNDKESESCLPLQLTKDGTV